MTPQTEAEIILEDTGNIGIITLNRPRAFNSLSTNMCHLIGDALLKWAEDDTIQAVVIKSDHEKAFCAGGDVKTLAQNSPEDHSRATEFFRSEYIMNNQIHNFPKPYISLLNGITMGGGVGISVHGSHRIITEKCLFAMPETAIGLIPDVGGSYFLPRLSGKLGLYIGLTGARLKAADIIYSGIGTNYITSDRLGDFIAALKAKDIRSNSDVDQVIAGFSSEPDVAPLESVRKTIDAAFSKNTIEEIIGSLEGTKSDWADKTASILKKMSPVSLKLTMEQLKRGGELSFSEVQKMEFRIVSHIVAYQSDFYEGVRALLIDKDQNPIWNPLSLKEVTNKRVTEHFERLGTNEFNI